MKISVVTVSFNQAPYLEAAIRSVIEQQGCEIEYIVVDPGSKDGSRDIIARYAPHIAVQLLEPDRGPGDGLNKGFAHATGDIYCYLNSDDVFLPGAFAKAVEYFQRHRDWDVICGNGYVIDGAGKRLRRVYSDRFGLRPAAYGSAIAIQPSTFFRARAFHAAGGFNVENRSNWDGELAIDMALAGAVFRNVPDFMSCYRVYAESITGSARLADAHEQFERRMFRKIVGRDWHRLDVVPLACYRVAKHLANPRATLERVFKGPVFGRSQ
ncbi:glycosyltransferase [Cupriavidus respiraculi]|uniref:glycosyltransferase family 2 protein n=1 Tax=Cupriavidus respiraculi TaxID=195930 RepID=UPI001C94CA79|nr:glycosyltransferase family 2 protein [Cupriavidus respiraculi]MBY4947159.1 glycosyltransferase [Cupriavidus respiraculi]